MKTLFFILAAAVLPTSYAQSNSPGTGCAWNDSHGACLVANNSDQPQICDIRIQVTTTNGQKTTKVNGVIIEVNDVYQTKQFRAAWDEKIEKAQIAAQCQRIERD